MKQIRIGVIALLAVVGVWLLMSEPSEDMNWGVMMLCKSLAGFGCWGVCAKLYKVWVRYE